MYEELINIELKLTQENSYIVEELILYLVMHNALDQSYARDVFLKANAIRNIKQSSTNSFQFMKNY